MLDIEKNFIKDITLLAPEQTWTDLRRPDELFLNIRFWYSYLCFEITLILQHFSLVAVLVPQS